MVLTVETKRDITYIGVDGKTILTIHFGEQCYPADESIVHINIDPKLWKTLYKIEDVHLQPFGTLYIRLVKP